jgi:hypothetical protein
MRGMVVQMNALANNGPVIIRLEDWLRETTTVCTAQAVFGPNNPFTQDPSLIQDFWYDNSFTNIGSKEDQENIQLNYV